MPEADTLLSREQKIEHLVTDLTWMGEEHAVSSARYLSYSTSRRKRLICAAYAAEIASKLFWALARAVGSRAFQKGNITGADSGAA
jgi:hypothetical protein